MKLESSVLGLRETYQIRGLSLGGHSRVPQQEVVNKLKHFFVEIFFNLKILFLLQSACLKNLSILMNAPKGKQIENKGVFFNWKILVFGFENSK